MRAAASRQILEREAFSSRFARSCDRSLPVRDQARLRFVGPVDCRVRQHIAEPQKILDVVRSDIITHRGDLPGEDRVVDHRERRASTALLNASSIGR